MKNKIKKLFKMLFLAFIVIFTTTTVKAVTVELLPFKPLSENHILEIQFRNANLSPGDSMVLTLNYINNSKTIVINQIPGSDFRLYDTSFYEGFQTYCASGSMLVNDYNIGIKEMCFEHYEKENFLRIIQNPIPYLYKEDDHIDVDLGVDNSTPNEPFQVYLDFFAEDLDTKVVNFFDTVFTVVNQKNISFRLENYPLQRGRYLCTVKVQNVYASDMAYLSLVFNPAKPVFRIQPDDFIDLVFNYGYKCKLKIITDGNVFDTIVSNYFLLKYPTANDITLIATDDLGGETIYKPKSLGIEIVSFKDNYVYEFYDYMNNRLNSRPTEIGSYYTEVTKDISKQKFKDQIISVKKCLVRYKE